jgi:hypothetical protein
MRRVPDLPQIIYRKSKIYSAFQQRLQHLRRESPSLRLASGLVENLPQENVVNTVLRFDIDSSHVLISLGLSKRENRKLENHQTMAANSQLNIHGQMAVNQTRWNGGFCPKVCNFEQFPSCPLCTISNTSRWQLPVKTRDPHKRQNPGPVRYVEAPVQFLMCLAACATEQANILTSKRIRQSTVIVQKPS